MQVDDGLRRRSRRASLGLDRLECHARGPQSGEAGVAQLMAGCVFKPPSTSGAGHDLVEAVARERLAAIGALHS